MLERYSKKFRIKKNIYKLIRFLYPKISKQRLSNKIAVKNRKKEKKLNTQYPRRGSRELPAQFFF